MHHVASEKEWWIFQGEKQTSDDEKKIEKICFSSRDVFLTWKMKGKIDFSIPLPTQPLMPRVRARKASTSQTTKIIFPECSLSALVIVFKSKIDSTPSAMCVCVCSRLISIYLSEREEREKKIISAWKRSLLMGKRENMWEGNLIRWNCSFRMMIYLLLSLTLLPSTHTHINVSDILKLTLW